MAMDHESRWLRDFFWREQEWLRPKFEERVHEQQQMNSVNSQTPQCDKKGDRSVIDVVRIDNLISLSFTSIDIC